MKGVALAEQRSALQRLRNYQHVEDDELEFNRLLFEALRQDGDEEPDDADLERGIITFDGYKRKHTGNPLHFAAWRLTDKHPRGLVTKILPRLLSRWPQSSSSKANRCNVEAQPGLTRADSVRSRRSDSKDFSPSSLLSPQRVGPRRLRSMSRMTATSPALSPREPARPSGLKGSTIVEVQRSPGKQLGMVVKIENNQLVVEAVEESGLIPDQLRIYERQNGSKDDKKTIEAGSRIVEVNGLRGDPEEMLEEMHMEYGSSKLRLKVVPNSCTNDDQDQDTGDPFDFLGCAYAISYGKDSMVWPIHLAVSNGNQEVYLGLLQDDPAQARAMAFHDYEPHFEPIHDAVWFGKVQAVQDLLEWKADVNAGNRRAHRPLHIAAKLGHTSIASVLLEQKADVYLRTAVPEEETPLETAIKGGLFDRAELHMLARTIKLDLDKIARASIDGAVAMLKKEKERLAQEKGVRTDLIHVDVLARLLKQAPSAAPQILEEILEEPRVASANAYPLPTRAAVGESCLRATCRTTTVWEHNTNISTPTPLWHKYFAPRCEEEEEFEVEVKVARIGNLYSEKILKVLADMPQGNSGAFGTPVAGGLVAVAWQNGVFRRYVFDMCQECVLLATIAAWVSGRLQNPTWCGACSTMLFSMIGREMFRVLLSGFATFHRLLDNKQDEGDEQGVRNAAWTALDDVMEEALSSISSRELVGLLSTFFLIGLAESAPTQSGSVEIGACEESATSPFLALSALCWLLRFLHRLRAFSWFGTHHLSMAQSFQGIWKMVLVLAVMFAGFVMIFRAKCGRDQVSWHDIQVNTFKLLLMGDGGAFDSFVEHCGTGITIWLVLGVFFFSVCILNQFVAIFNEGYSAAEKAGFTTFLQERAKVCHAYRTRFAPPEFMLRMPRGLVLLAIAAWDASNLGVLAVKRYFPGMEPIASLLQPWASFDLLVPALVFYLTWRVDYEIGQLGACGDPDQVLAQLMQLLHPNDGKHGGSPLARRDGHQRATQRQPTMSRAASEVTTPGNRVGRQVSAVSGMNRSVSNLSSATDKTQSDKADKNDLVHSQSSGPLDFAALTQESSRASLLIGFAGFMMWVAFAVGLIAGVDSTIFEGARPRLVTAWLGLVVTVHATLLFLGGAGTLCLLWHVGLPTMIATLDLLPRFVRSYMASCRDARECKMVPVGQAVSEMRNAFHKISMLSHASFPSVNMEKEVADSRKVPNYLWVCYRSDYNTLQLGEESAREQAQREERRLFERRIEGILGQVVSLTSDVADNKLLLEQLSHQVADLSTSHEAIPEPPILSRAPSIAVGRAATVGP